MLIEERPSIASGGRPYSSEVYEPVGSTLIHALAIGMPRLPDLCFLRHYRRRRSIGLRMQRGVWLVAKERRGALLQF